jgi:hypothetical protein
LQDQYVASREVVGNQGFSAEPASLGGQELRFHPEGLGSQDVNRRGHLYRGWKGSMAAENLADLINRLTLEDQDSVTQFVEFFKGRQAPPSSPSFAAVDEFIDRHPELRVLDHEAHR